MALISQAELEARIGRSLTTAESSAFESINNAMQAEVERLIGSSVEDESPSTRYFDGGIQHLAINPCTAITAVEWVDDDYIVIYTLDTSDYTTEPVNKTIKTMIRYRPGILPRGINNIAVTATFSIYDDSDTLAIVKNALLEALEAELENNDNIQSESIEGYSITYATAEAKNALNSIQYLFPGII